MFMLTPGRFSIEKNEEQKCSTCLCASSLPFSCAHACVMCDPGPHYCQLGLVRMAQWEAGQSRYKLTSLSTASPPIESIFSSASMQKAQESVHRRLATTKHFDLQYSVVLMHAHDNIRTAVILLSPLSRICNCFFRRCVQFSCPFSTLSYSKGAFLWGDPDQIMVHQREPMNRL